MGNWQGILSQGQIITFLSLVIFFLIPFQRRFHGFFDSLSRRLTLPDVSLPDFFSRKIHLFFSDFIVIILALYLLFVCKERLRNFFWEGPSKYLTLLFFVLFVSTTVSISKSYSLQYLRLIQFSLSFLFFNSLRCSCVKLNFSRIVYKVAWLFICLAFFECAVGIAQYFTQDSVGLKFLGEKSPKTFPFVNPGHSLWFFGSKQEAAFLYRVSGTFLHPNILGGFLFCCILATYYLFFLTKSKVKRVCLAGMVFLQFFTLYLSFSRAALLAIAFSTLLWFGLQWNKSRKSGSFKIIAGVIFCSACLGVYALYPQLSARGGIFNLNTNSLGADTERVMYMKVASQMIQEHPFLGVGYNNFQIHAHRFQDQFPNNRLHSKVHNIYLLIGSEAGLIGGGIFLLFLCSLLRASWRGISKSISDEEFQAKAFLLSLFLGFLLIGGCDFYFLETPQGSIPFFGIAGLLGGINAQFFQINKKFSLRGIS